MYDHHKQSIQILVDMMKQRQGVLAIVLGGSVAKGLERPDSDIDAMIFLNDEAYKTLEDEKKTADCIDGYCTYEGGYFDLKYYCKDYLVVANQTGSEPTRNAFVSAKILYCVDNDIPPLVETLGQYPVHEKDEKILSFLGALSLHVGYFWVEAQRANDLFFKVRTAGDIVFYGYRLILAHNEQLFPCTKRLEETVQKCSQKPDDVVALANDFLAKLDNESKSLFVHAVLSLGTYKEQMEDRRLLLARFIDDNELWWWKNKPTIAEW